MGLTVTLSLVNEAKLGQSVRLEKRTAELDVLMLPMVSVPAPRHSA